MKLLFLDIDGVLNSYRTYYVWGSGDPCMLLTNDGPKLDPVAVALLEKVVNLYDFKIILSSTWRFGYTDEEIINQWKGGMSMHYGWKNPLIPIIGQTPDLTGMVDSGLWVSKTRGAEIQAYIDNLDSAPDDWNILDDDSDMLESQYSRFYNVDRQIGITDRFPVWVEDRYK